MIRRCLLTAAAVLAAGPGGAGREGEPVNLSASPGFSMTPRFVTGGGPALLWREGHAGDAQVYLAAGGAGARSYSAPRRVSGTPGPAYLPSGVFDAAGGMHVVWREPFFPAGLVYYASAPDPAAAFGPARVLSGGPPAFRAEIARGRGGALLALWDEGRESRLARSLDGGAAWTVPAHLELPGRLLVQGLLRADGEGRVAVLQHAVAGANGQAILRLSNSNGTRFGPPAVISRGYPDVGETALALGRGGRIHAAWSHLTGDLPGRPDRVVLWSGRGRGGLAVPVAPGHEPALAEDGGGAVHLVWRHLGEIFYCRTDGRRFTPPRNISRTPGGLAPHAPGYSSRPDVWVDSGTGEVHIAWQEAVAADNDEILLVTLPGRAPPPGQTQEPAPAGGVWNGGREG